MPSITRKLRSRLPSTRNSSVARQDDSDRDVPAVQSSFPHRKPGDDDYESRLETVEPDRIQKARRSHGDTIQRKPKFPRKLQNLNPLPRQPVVGHKQEQKQEKPERNRSLPTRLDSGSIQHKKQADMTDMHQTEGTSEEDNMFLERIRRILRGGKNTDDRTNSSRQDESSGNSQTSVEERSFGVNGDICEKSQATTIETGDDPPIARQQFAFTLDLQPFFDGECSDEEEMKIPRQIGKCMVVAEASPQDPEDTDKRVKCCSDSKRTQVENETVAQPEINVTADNTVSIEKNDESDKKVMLGSQDKSVSAGKEVKTPDKETIQKGGEKGQPRLSFMRETESSARRRQEKAAMAGASPPPVVRPRKTRHTASRLSPSTVASSPAAVAPSKTRLSTTRSSPSPSRKDKTSKGDEEDNLHRDTRKKNGRASTDKSTQNNREDIQVQDDRRAKREGASPFRSSTTPHQGGSTPLASGRVHEESKGMPWERPRSLNQKEIPTVKETMSSKEDQDTGKRSVPRQEPTAKSNSGPVQNRNEKQNPTVKERMSSKEYMETRKRILSRQDSFGKSNSGSVENRNEKHNQEMDAREKNKARASTRDKPKLEAGNPVVRTTSIATTTDQAIDLVPGKPPRSNTEENTQTRKAIVVRSDKEEPATSVANNGKLYGEFG